MQAEPAPDEFDLAVIDRLLTTTRSVRRRLDLDRPVPRPVITECLRLALQAPTGSNAQNWRWVVVDDPALRAELGALYRQGQAAGEADRAASATRGPGPGPAVDASVAHLRDNLHRVPALVIPCIPRQTHGAAGWGPSIYPAVWSLQLALRSRGLGSCLTTSHLRREREAAELLGIPEEYAQACLVAVAYHLGTSFRPGRRLPVDEVLFWDHWGS